ncbi:hypothetical protein H5410_040974 [Solanum commersonii]|uniref:Uncharacterized protein n=1 Tax=Solanum commersonii TaxID=4109 RepID=A0A9J5XT42_SOLCO|nr:hypothetical protein H5410_040974 [Solanum commersonii]
MEEDPEEDSREPTNDMEEDPEEYSDHDPNLYDLSDGRLMNPHSISQGLTMIWEIMMMLQPSPRSPIVIVFFHKLLKVPCGLSLLYVLSPLLYCHFLGF